MTLRPVVVGVDGSAHSHRALDWAVDYATLIGAPLRVICAWEIPPHWDALSASDPTVHRRAAEEIVASAARLVPDDLPSESHTVQGHPAGVLVQESDGASVLVVGSRGRGGFVDMLLGSVTSYCSHHARCSVVIVRGD